MSSDMGMSDLMAIFLEEAQEQLQKLDDGFLQIEKNPDDLEVIKEIFRAAHTLKGSSATMGFTEIAEMTHAMENLLDLLRSSSLKASSEIVDLLLRSTDTLRVLVTQVSSGEAMNADTEDLLTGLREACNQAQNIDAPVRLSNAPKTSLPVSDVPGTMNLKLKIKDDCMMPSVRAFMVYNSLAGLGEMISSDPSQDNVDSLQAGQEILITFLPSKSPESVLDGMHRLSEVELVDYSMPEKQQSMDNKSGKTEAARKPETVDSTSKSIQTVRVGVDRLDMLMNLVAELVIDRTRISRIESEFLLKYENDDLVKNLGETAVHIGRVVNELQEHIMKVRLLPVEQVFNRFPRMVRDLAQKAGKEIDFILEGQETELDRSILEDIVDPITHLLRNAVDHGVETPDEREALGKPRRARVVLAAKQEENRIIIEVEEDGRGIAIDKVKAAALKKGVVSEEALERMSDEDALQLIFAAGVSTAEKITDVSGRGVGMDVVRNNIQNLSGSVEVNTAPGQGTKFRINLPLTLAIIQALVTGVGDTVFVVPLGAVAETFRCSKSDVRYIGGNPAINFRGSVLHLLHLGDLFSIPKTEKSVEDEDYMTFVVVRTGTLKVGLVVDRLIGEQEVVIKSLGAFFGDIKGIAGATILGDGKVALILDLGSLGAIVNRRKNSRNYVEVAGI